MMCVILGETAGLLKEANFNLFRNGKDDLCVKASKMIIT